MGYFLTGGSIWEGVLPYHGVSGICRPILTLGYTAEPILGGTIENPTFKGLRFHFFCNTQPTWTYDDFKLDYKGHFTIQFGNMKTNVILSNPPFDYQRIGSENSIYRMGSIDIPARQIYKMSNPKLSLIQANFGALNNNYNIITPVNINFTNKK